MVTQKNVIFDLFKVFNYIATSQNGYFFYDISIFLYVCASCSELPSDISTKECTHPWRNQRLIWRTIDRSDGTIDSAVYRLNINPRNFSSDVVGGECVHLF